jgi:hypothetical protein
MRRDSSYVYNVLYSIKNDLRQVVNFCCSCTPMKMKFMKLNSVSVRGFFYREKTETGEMFFFTFETANFFRNGRMDRTSNERTNERTNPPLIC